MVTGTHNGLYCWNKPPWKTSGTYSFLPKGKCGSWLAKKYVKSCREGGKSRIVGVLNPIPIYCQGLSWPTIQPYCIPVLGLFKSASLPWHKQTELIECLPLASWSVWEPEYISDPYWLLEMWRKSLKHGGKVRKLNPWPRVINIVMLLLIGTEKQLLARKGTKALRL